MFIFNYTTTDLKLLSYIMLVSFLVFLIAMSGFFLYSYNFILFLLLNEVIIFSIICLFLCSSFLLDDLTGQVFVLFILVISSCEIVIGLSLIVSFYKKRNTISIYDYLILVKKKLDSKSRNKANDF